MARYKVTYEFRKTYFITDEELAESNREQSESGARELARWMAWDEIDAAPCFSAGKVKSTIIEE